MQLAPRGEAKIGYTFSPQRMADHQAMICIDADTPYGSLEWLYEIQGMAESAQVTRFLRFPPPKCSFSLLFHLFPGGDIGQVVMQGSAERAEGCPSPVGWQ